MAKGAYIGVSSVARKVKKGYVGIGGVARKVKKAYIGVGGVARLFWSGENFKTILYGSSGAVVSETNPPTSFSDFAPYSSVAGNCKIFHDADNERFVLLKYVSSSSAQVYTMPVDGSTWTLTNTISSYISPTYATLINSYIYVSSPTPLCFPVIGNGTTTSFRAISNASSVNGIKYINGRFFATFLNTSASVCLASTTGTSAAWTVSTIRSANSSARAYFKTGYESAIWYDNGTYYVYFVSSHYHYIYSGSAYNSLSQASQFGETSSSSSYGTPSGITVAWGGVIIPISYSTQQGTWKLVAGSNTPTKIANSICGASARPTPASAYFTGSKIFATQDAGSNFYYSLGGEWTVIVVSNISSGYVISTIEE